MKTKNYKVDKMNYYKMENWNSKKNKKKIDNFLD